jgi:multicomponent Na+:H+ antiporter subunit D
MGLIVFLATTGIGLALSLVFGPSGRPARLISIAGMAAASGTALLIGSSDKLTIGDVQLAGGAYAGYFLASLAAAALLIMVIGLGSAWPERLGTASFAALGGMGLALTAVDAGVALTGAAAGMSVSAIVITRGTSADRAPEIRTTGIVVGAIMLAAIVALQPFWTSGNGDAGFTLALLGLGLAFAARSGAVPFHRTAVRLRTTATPMASALLLVWIPACLGTLAISWSALAFGVGGGAMNWVVATLLAIAVATLLLGAVGALLSDALEEIAAYSILQDAAFVLLALAARSEDVADPARFWLLVFVAAKTGLIAWVAAAGRVFGTSHLSAMKGWLRRTPLLGLAIVAIAIATLGLPGTPVYEARATLIRLALPSGAAFLGPAAILLSVAVYGRLLAVGLMSPLASVRASRSERPRFGRGGRASAVAEPVAESTPAATLEADAAAELTAAPTLEADTAAGALTPPRPSRLGVRGRIVLAWRLNRTLEMSLVLGCGAALALALAFGGFGARSASESGIPLDGAAHATPRLLPLPTVTPLPTPDPSAIVSPTPAGSPGPSDSAAPGTAATPSPVKTLAPNREITE